MSLWLFGKDFSINHLYIWLKIISPSLHETQPVRYMQMYTWLHRQYVNERMTCMLSFKIFLSLYSSRSLQRNNFAGANSGAECLTLGRCSVCRQLILGSQLEAIRVNCVKIAVLVEILGASKRATESSNTPDRLGSNTSSLLSISPQSSDTPQG